MKSPSAISGSKADSPEVTVSNSPSHLRVTRLDMNVRMWLSIWTDVSSSSRMAVPFVIDWTRAMRPCICVSFDKKVRVPLVMALLRCTVIRSLRLFVAVLTERIRCVINGVSLAMVMVACPVRVSSRVGVSTVGRSGRLADGSTGLSMVCSRSKVRLLTSSIKMLRILSFTSNRSRVRLPPA